MILGINMSHANNTYAELLDYFEPRPITCDEEYWATNAIIGELLSEPALSEDAQAYLHLLSMLIEAYDEEQNTIPELRGIELLRTLIEESDFEQYDLLFIFEGESLLSKILAGEHYLTAAHINQLATFFDLPHQLFFDEPVQTLSSNGIQQSALIPVG
ncbi:MAG: transcriptional regulator [Chloroflexota bacterium]